MKNLQEADLRGKRVFYRPDYNVPLKDGEIQDDFRILATLPTLDFLVQSGAKVIIGTHLGRPDGQRVPEFELRPIAERLADLYPKQKVQLAHQILAAEVQWAISHMKPGDILILPNLRFFPEEEENNDRFAHDLSTLADVYVDDAFAAVHRAHASIVGVPHHLPGYPGFLLEKEVETLTGLMKNPERPFVVVMGGAKISDKIEVIRTLAQQADAILIGGAMANTFLQAKGEPIGQSKSEPDKVDVAESLIKELGERLILAADYVKDVVSDDQFRYLDIGEQAISDFKHYLSHAKTIFWNGSLGYSEDPRFAKATNEIAEFIAGLEGVTSVVAGGDTVETITRLQLHEHFSFVSTGGGAALELLAGKELPGVKVLAD